MPIEIERKFLVLNEDFKKGASLISIKQGFLSLDKERIVRVRSSSKKAFLTIKGINRGISRVEYEYEIPLIDAEKMLNKHCIQPIICKTRYLITYCDKCWEVDVFHNENEGLVIAELEVNSVEEKFDKPQWIGKEVSNDPKYYNSNLVLNPFVKW